MDLVFLDSNFNTIKFVDYINLQWNRRYYECGQYSVQILARDFDKEFQYVYRASEREIGVVQNLAAELVCRQNLRNRFHGLLQTDNKFLVLGYVYGM